METGSCLSAHSCGCEDEIQRCLWRIDKNVEGAPRTGRLLSRYLLLLLTLPLISCIMYFNLENSFGYQKSPWQIKLANVNAKKKAIDVDYLSEYLSCAKVETVLSYCHKKSTSKIIVAIGKLMTA